MSRGRGRPTQGLELALLTGGAATAAGLYVSTAVLKRTYAESRRLFSWLLPEEALEEPPSRTVRCAFPQFKSAPPILFARARGGGGLLLAAQSVFYLQAPEMWLYRLVPESKDQVTLETPAFYLFMAARAWMLPSAFRAKEATEACDRLTVFLSECVLHRLLSDLFRNASNFNSEQRTLVSSLLDKLSPDRGLFRVSAPPALTAKALLEGLGQAQWRALDAALDKTRSPLIPSERWLGSSLDMSEISFLKLGFENADGSNMQPIDVKGVGRCSRLGRMAYRIEA